MALKADFILSLMELIVGGKDGLQPVERTVIDRCVRQMYREHLQLSLIHILSRCRAGCRGKSLISGLFPSLTTKTTEK